MSDADDALLPCPAPWCESEVIEVVYSPWSRGYYAACQSCRCQGPSLATHAEAIAAWNRRAPDERDEQIARLREKVALAQLNDIRQRKGHPPIERLDQMRPEDVEDWLSGADAAIAAYHPIAMELAAGVAQRYLAADAHNVAMPMLRERYGDESCEHASEHLRMASESVPAAIRAITPPQGAAMEEGK